LLKHPDKCKLDQVNTYNKTALINACNNGMKEVALEMLKYPDQCKLDQVNLFGCTSLIYACTNKMTEVALEMLKHPDKCKLDQVDSYGNTTLMTACIYEMKEVALEMLKHPDKCKLEHVDESGNNALFYAQKNNMTNVIDILSTHVDINSTLQFKNGQKELFEMQKQHNKLNDMLDKINNVSKYGGCIICLENMHGNKCKHILSV